MITTLDELSQLAQKLSESKKQLEKMELAVKEKKESIKKLEEELIPEALQSVGLTEVTLKSGAKVGYERVFFASISEENNPAAIKWLKDNGYAALVKTQVAMNFGAGLEEQVDHKLLENFLTENEIEFNEKSGVHSQTLKAFVRQRIPFEEDVANAVPADKKLPRDIFGVYAPLKAVVTEPSKQTK